MRGFLLLFLETSAVESGAWEEEEEERERERWEERERGGEGGARGLPMRTSAAAARAHSPPL